MKLSAVWAYTGGEMLEMHKHGWKIDVQFISEFESAKLEEKSDFL